MPKNSYDPDVVRGLSCPICKSSGTLLPIGPRRRMRAGPWSYALTFNKSFECTACGAMLSTEQMLRDKQPA